MKTLKKLLSVFAVVAMLLSMTVSANAATVTVVDNDDLTDHTYVAYQVLSGTQAPDSASLGSVVWGSGINSTKFLEEVNKISGFETIDNPAAFAEKLATYANNSVEAVAVSKAAYAAKTGSGIELEIGQNTIDPGYYLIVDVTENVGNEDARNAALLQVTQNGDVTIGNKTTIPTVEKWVQKDGNWGKYEDAYIGQSVSMKFEATVPSMYYFDTYPITFTDTATGLTPITITSVSIEQTGKAATALAADTHYTLAPTNEDFTLTIADLKALAVAASFDVKEAVKVVVEYTTTLATDADLGNDGNSNTVKLTYNANPNGSENKETAQSTVYVYAFQIEGTKVDGVDQTKKLNGAVFALKNADGKYYANTAGVVSWVDSEDDATKSTSTADGLFGFTGLDAGTYTLVEITPPLGYNKAGDQEVTITPAYDNDTNKIKTLTNGELTDGKVSVTVLNNKGATLPETGGIGTTMFYVIGAALVIGAGVVLVSKKRMAAK